MTELLMDNESMFLVRVSCLTYNHSAFIADALSGFAMQQTSFPFVCTIIDDASTDGEQEVVKAYVDEHFDMNDSSVFYEKEEEYGRVTFARHKTNANCYFAVIYLKENHYSQCKSKSPYIEKWVDTKYIAICEGDDYWTDPLKLQKQVDFMEAHPNYSMCFHKVIVDAKEDWEHRLFEHVRAGDYTDRQIFEKWTIPTCSAMYRFFVPQYDKRVVYGDIFLWLQLSELGKLCCLDFVGGVYRRHEGGISVLKDYSTYPKLASQYRFMAKRFPQLKDVARKKEDDNLRIVIYMPYFDGICKYRFRYMFLHPNLILSGFFTTTLLSYTRFRHH